MKKLIVILTILAVLTGIGNACAKNNYVTTGGYYFAPTKQMLQTTLYYYNRGDHATVWGFVDSGMATVFPQGLPIELYTSGKIIRVYFADSPDVVWWTTRAAISHKKIK